MSSLTKYNPEAVNRALINESGQPAAMVAAFAKSFHSGHQMRNLPIVERIKALEPIISAYYVRSQVNTYAVDVIVDMMAEGQIGRLSVDEMNIAFRLAAAGQLFDVEFSFVPTAANFGQVLSAYIETKRRALVAAQIKLEEKAKKAEEERERANRKPTEAHLEKIRSEIRDYARRYIAIQQGKSAATELEAKAVWAYQVEEAVAANQLLRLTADEQLAERGRAVGEGRRMARGETGVVTMADQLKAIDSYAKGIEKAYLAARLIERNSEFFAHKF
jgi:hypothetical protein